MSRSGDLAIGRSGDLKIQEYFCPACRYRGQIEYTTPAPVFGVIVLIDEDHKKNRPMCEQDVTKIRVRNPELCSVAMWAQITGETAE